MDGERVQYRRPTGIQGPLLVTWQVDRRLREEEIACALRPTLLDSGIHKHTARSARRKVSIEEVLFAWRGPSHLFSFSFRHPRQSPEWMWVDLARSGL